VNQNSDLEGPQTGDCLEIPEFREISKSAKQEFGSFWDRHTIRAENPAKSGVSRSEHTGGLTTQQQASELQAWGGPHVSADLRVAAARQSPQSAARPRGAQQPASQPDHAKSAKSGENAAKAIRPPWSHPRPRERARDVREVVGDVLRPPE
jgi:hypothetical protein